MRYQTEINGIQVDATYTEDNIRDIFIPVLKKAQQLFANKGKRVLVFLAAPPGAGKSTLLSFLKFLSEREPGLLPVTTIGMDGFHRYQDYLVSHSILRDGKEYKMVEVKGCPETFDLERFTERVKLVSEGERCGWPEYNRMTHNPKEDAITVDGDIVILEGNYLLLDRPGWRELRQYADLTISVRADEGLLRERLVRRKADSGNSREVAESFVDFSDMYNVRLCLAESVEADINLEIVSDGSYRMA
ncbi:MAG: nucleoside/nucleotide kinase family protein [Lachnospiraceae bacterium]|nr:nucleoside/nucleotide kinase family protein [Lachnospiraceae bacterium]